MRQSIFAMVSGGLFLSSCQLFLDKPVPAPPGPAIEDAVLEGDDCPEGDGAFLFWIEPPSVEVGEKVTLEPAASPGPWYFDYLPGGCLGQLIAEPAEAVLFSRDEDGTPIAEITEAAKPGQTIILSARYKGEDAVSGRVLVYDSEQNPLVGTWTQVDNGECAPESRMRELYFLGDGRFAATWQPFESYKDYWGNYEFDVNTGVLTLSPEGGNYIPDDVISGLVTVEGDTLIQGNGMGFGSTRGGLSCDAPFKRVR